MSVDLYEMFPNFWENSMFVKPDDGRKVVCHPTAWDMGNREDFRYDESTDTHIWARYSHVETGIRKQAKSIQLSDIELQNGINYSPKRSTFFCPCQKFNKIKNTFLIFYFCHT